MEVLSPPKVIHQSFLELLHIATGAIANCCVNGIKLETNIVVGKWAVQIVKVIKFYIIFTIHYSVSSLVSVSIEKKCWKGTRRFCPLLKTLRSFAKSTPLLHLFSTLFSVSRNLVKYFVFDKLQLKPSNHFSSYRQADQVNLFQTTTE